jgi:hypothetical protein
MAEIKSTMDLIMERIKGLSMSDEEKRAIKEKDMKEKTRGYLQKYLNSRMDLEALEKKMEAFDDQNRREARRSLIKQCLDLIEPETDNARLLAVLEKLGGVDAQLLHGFLSKFHNELAGQKKEREEKSWAKLRGQGISGSAVVPNIKADPSWVQFQQERKEDFKKKLDFLCSAWMNDSD